MTNVYVAGCAMTPFTRHLDLSVADLTRQAVSQALADCGAQVGHVDIAFFSNTTQSITEGQHLAAGQMALRKMGFAGIPISNVENACASASTALHHAVMAIRSGMHEVALAVGVDKMIVPDRARTYEVFNGAWDVHDVEKTQANIRAMGAAIAVPPGMEAINERKPSPFMEIYANWGRFHMKSFGTTQRQLAAVASKNRIHAVENDRAQFREGMDVDAVLASRAIAWPLTLPMCSPVSDGAAAAIICSKAALARFAESRPIRIDACVLGTGIARRADDLANHLSRIAALKAYEAAGISPADVSVAEVHDATSVGEIMQSEFLGLVEFGFGGPAAERGETRIGGRIPINPSGGLESKGHPIGATGLGQIYELVSQLRGDAGPRQVEGAKVAIAENGGGIYGVEESVTCVTILSR
jgi:acetyl-CoA acyltransferase